jgi:hypothetical protein
LQIPDPEKRNRPVCGEPASFRKSSSPPETADILETAAQRQARRVAQRFLVTPETAATIARLAYGEAAA